MLADAKLGNRLLACASFVRQGAVLADVGTDHAYIPIYLCEHGIISFAIASDIGKGPLSRAEEHIRLYGLESKIKTVLTDGLHGLESVGATDIVIAGMGGLLIRDILEAAPFVKNKAIRLILQPMKNADDLRAYLYGAGFFIDDEKLAEDDGKIYTVMQVSYTGFCCTKAPLSLLLGEKNIEKRKQNPLLFFMLLQKYLLMYQKKIEGMAHGSEEWNTAKEIYDAFTALQSETEK